MTRGALRIEQRELAVRGNCEVMPHPGKRMPTHGPFGTPEGAFSWMRRADCMQKEQPGARQPALMASPAQGTLTRDYSPSALSCK